MNSWQALLGGVRVLFGAGRLAELGTVARELGARRLLLVTDPGVAAAGHAAAAVAALEQAGLDTLLSDRAEENPTSDTVAAAARAAGGREIDLIVGLGGGSALDTAKGANFLLTNGGTMADYWGYGKAERPLLPSIGIPTTAGTGSEAQSYALITHPETHRKMACGAEGARFRTVILDPLLAATAPPAVAATAGLDAVSHAVESYVTTRGNPVSRLLAREAWRLLDGSLEAVFAQAGEGMRSAEGLDCWGRALLGAHLAGAAIEQSMLGAAHAAANPLTARCGVLHGEAVALMLPHVVRFNGEVAGALYRELSDSAAALARRVERLRAAGGLPAHLAERGVVREALPELARAACDEWTGKHNPRPVDKTEFLKLYEAAF